MDPTLNFCTPKTIQEDENGSISAIYVRKAGIWKLAPASQTDDGNDRDIRDIQIRIFEKASAPEDISSSSSTAYFGIEELTFMTNDEKISTFDESLLRAMCIWGSNDLPDNVILLDSDNIPVLHKAWCPFSEFWLKIVASGEVHITVRYGPKVDYVIEGPKTGGEQIDLITAVWEKEEALVRGELESLFFVETGVRKIKKIYTDAFLKISSTTGHIFIYRGCEWKSALLSRLGPSPYTISLTERSWDGENLVYVQWEIPVSYRDGVLHIRECTT
jgi:hypothetical protein